MENRVSFVNFLTHAKYYILVGISIALLIICSVLIYAYNTEKYNEKAITLLETTTNDYEKLIEILQNSDENTEKSKDNSNTSSDLEENNITHEKVLEALNEVIETYPKSFASQKALMQSGTIRMHLKEYENAYNNFLSASQKRHKTYITPIAYLHAAISQENMNLTSDIHNSKAQEYYQHIIDVYPKSIVAAHAYFSLGRLAEQDVEKSSNVQSSARSYYKTLIKNDQFRDSIWASLAQSRIIALDNQKK